MLIFAGLGNPGGKYAGTRHNIGWMAVDAIAVTHGFQPWRGKFQGQCAEGRLGTEKVLLLKPETFMNLSGQSVGEALRFYKLDAADVWVFHDELDLAPGKVRTKTGGGHAGHNGLRSLHQHIGDGYGRVRLGIGHPGQKDLVSGYVLGGFANADRDWLEPLLAGVAKAAPHLAAGDAAKFMNAVALERAPAPSTAASAKASPSKEMQPTPDASPPPETPPADDRSPLQRLADRFRR